jgi:hypothetical protein
MLHICLSFLLLLFPLLSFTKKENNTSEKTLFGKILENAEKQSLNLSRKLSLYMNGSYSEYRWPFPIPGDITPEDYEEFAAHGNDYKKNLKQSEKLIRILKEKYEALSQSEKKLINGVLSQAKSQGAFKFYPNSIDLSCS